MSGAPNLTSWQDGFLRALLAPAGDGNGPVAQLEAQPGFAVYRNTFLKSCLDALQGNFPAVARLVGEEWFRAAASRYVHESPPRVPMLVTYGEGFAAFLERFEPAGELPYLPGVARLDRAWTESLVAPETACLTIAELAAVPPEQLARTILVPHPAARWRWFEDLPIYSIWRGNREAVELDADLPQSGEGALITRPLDTVQWRSLTRAECHLLDACAAGRLLEDAALAAFPAFDDRMAPTLTTLLAELTTAGAFEKAVAAGASA